MLSATYARSSLHHEENFRKDPENRLLWRMNPVQRLDAETLRDTILAVSGRLDRTPGGPPNPLDGKHRRRALYATVSRTQPDRTMALFDFPDPNAHSARRAVTVGPMQRLYFLNSPFVMEQAEALARRLAKESPQGDRARIRRAYSLLYGRPPDSSEIRMGLEYLEGRKGSLAQVRSDAAGVQRFQFGELRWPELTGTALTIREGSRNVLPGGTQNEPT